MNQVSFKNYLHLHFIVLLFGFTAILGKLISIQAMELVAWRMGLAALGLGVIALIFYRFWEIPAKSILKIAATGIIVAIHWILFFAAVKVSNVSVTLGCMASGTLFASILEPLIERRKIWWVEVVLGLIIIGGLYIITQFAFNYITGIIYAIASAFFAILFGVINRQFSQTHNPIHISLIEMVAGSLIIVVYALISGTAFTPIANFTNLDFVWLLILAWVCTAYAFVGTVHLLKTMSAYSVSLVINLEPIYGILFAYWIFGESEKMDAGFYIGAGIILLAVFIYPILLNNFKAKELKTTD